MKKKTHTVDDLIEIKDGQLIIGGVAGTFDELKCQELVKDVLDKITTDDITLVEYTWIFGCILDFALARAKAIGELPFKATSHTMATILEYILQRHLGSSDEFSDHQMSEESANRNESNYMTKH